LAATSAACHVPFADSGRSAAIDIFTENGTPEVAGRGAPEPARGLRRHLHNFGPLSNTPLVSNNIDNSGTINAFNA
jgi:hypothetical protein